ncbi:MAG: hypothetical protein COA74_07020 [Gammaproteobacteria bacterium]|nr:MAG: hypothetical protein COA74_07020 [Gammaproteobacteria bacterium]
MSNVKKYLDQYAEPETQELENFPKDLAFKNCLVIPAYQETDAFLQEFINSQLAHQITLLILVINQPISDDDVIAQQQLFTSALEAGCVVWQQHNLFLIKLNNAAAYILAVDRFNQNLRIADKQGVGLARKIGADIAATLIDMKVIESSWICSTDADTHLPDNYFTSLEAMDHKSAAVTYDFQHLDHQDKVSEATLLYEKALKYYVSGLTWAGSHYAFFTIGSCLAFRYDYYCMARGFQKRSAGEDFYLLNKLAKLGQIQFNVTAKLLIEPRISSRVPFGTGPTVEKILKLPHPEQYLYYHPQLFSELKNCLVAMDDLWKFKDQPEQWLLQLSNSTQYALKQLRITKLFGHLQSNITNESQAKTHIHQWFDAFRTLKFIHYQQQDYYSQIPLVQALDKASFIPGYRAP